MTRLRGSGKRLAVGAVVLALAGSVWWGLRQPAVRMLLLEREALPGLEARVESDPNDWRVQFWYGKRAAEAGQFDRAEPALRRACGAAPSYTPAFTELGKLLLAAGRVDEAFQVLRGVVGRDAGATEAQLALAALYRQEGAYGKGLDVLKALLAREPRNLRALYEQAVCEAGIQHFPAAEASLRMALAVQPKDPPVLTALARVRRAQGDQAEAVRWGRAALKEAPDDPLALLELARALTMGAVDVGPREEALGLLRRAADLDPQNTLIPLEMGRILGEAGQWSAAAPLVEKAVSLSPNNTEGLYLLSRALRATGRLVEARQAEAAFQRRKRFQRRLEDLLARLGARPQENGIRLELAELFAAEGDTQRAINQFKGALQRDPANARARKRLTALLQQSLEKDSGVPPP